MTQHTVTATYYSLVGSKEAVLLVARWYDDCHTNATCWTELDREWFVDGEPTEAVWDRIKARNTHLLSAEAVA